ncbi:hypothetical protein ASG84_10850 [Rhodococcus sp. Leaf278]|uniref:hypothetical protein n=1 Tax=Rhodococcus sp. Leaf278 TaxID=1736319 RepID=UPI00070D8D35|nr:hypothetical protein [Rhodococcus sp. Leaf278]KQU45799.1 hypothetical protein ASG84_10850 [Rhodococcus sp. Leaf278]
MKHVRTLVVCASIVLGSALASVGTASAATAVPFQINPAPFGNPNGSFDAPSVRCVAVVGEQAGTVRVTGGKEGGWGCLISSQVYWVNLSSGAVGTAVTSAGVQGFVPEAILATGPGQVAITIVASGGIITPGLATVSVP